jgi:hypothetical protein
MDMKLDVVAGAHGAPELIRNLTVREVIAASLLGVAAKPKDLADVRHDRQLRPVALKLAQHPRGRLDHQLAGRPLPVTVDFVVEREDNLQHPYPLSRSKKTDARANGERRSPPVGSRSTTLGQRRRATWARAPPPRPARSGRRISTRSKSRNDHALDTARASRSRPLRGETLVTDGPPIVEAD